MKKEQEYIFHQKPNPDTNQQLVALPKEKNAEKKNVQPSQSRYTGSP